MPLALVIAPGRGSTCSSLLICPPPPKMLFQAHVFKLSQATCSKWHGLSCYDFRNPLHISAVHTQTHRERESYDPQIVGNTEFVFYVKLNKIFLWASLLPVPLSVLCSFPLPDKAVSPRCINAHQRPQSSCFATG